MNVGLQRLDNNMIRLRRRKRWQKGVWSPPKSCFWHQGRRSCI